MYFNMLFLFTFPGNIFFFPTILTREKFFNSRLHFFPVDISEQIVLHTFLSKSCSFVSQPAMLGNFCVHEFFFLFSLSPPFCSRIFFSFTSQRMSRVQIKGNVFLTQVLSVSLSNLLLCPFAKSVLFFFKICGLVRIHKKYIFVFQSENE